MKLRDRVPRVVVHASICVDGRVAGFEADLELHYEIASRWGAEVHLTGADTILSAPAADDGETGPADAPVAGPPGDAGILAITDSRGRVRTWPWLLGSGLWSRGVALVSQQTPPEHVNWLHEHGIDVVAAGRGRVDLTGALVTLADRYGAETVLVDSGGRLSGALLARGLVTDISILVHPQVGGRGHAGPFLALGPGRHPGWPREVQAAGVESLGAGVVWLRYTVPGR